MEIFKKINKCLLRKIVRVQIKTSKVLWAGNRYGGFYIVPYKNLRNGRVFSFGIGEDLSFDKNLIDLFEGIHIYGFDPTPRSCRWVKTHCLDESRFEFYPYGISVKSGKSPFYLPKNPAYVSGSLMKNSNTGRKIEVLFKDIRKIMDETGVNKVDILKMDIEGSELDVIPDILDSGFEFTQLCTEIHYRFWGKTGLFKLYKLIKLLNNHGYYIAAVSDRYEEITFIKRKR